MPPPQSEVAALAIAEAARRAQVALRREMVRDLTRTWGLLDFAHLKQTWPTWLQVTQEILNRYHARSSDDAALFYRATRQVELGDPGTAKVAALPSPEWTSRALGYSAPGVYNKQTSKGLAPEQAKRVALAQTLSTSSRIMLDGARKTIEDSAHSDPAPNPVGWYFKTDGDPCAFCALLASRGIVYKGDSFEVSNAKFIGDGTARVHNGCACILAPAFKRSMTLPDISQEALQVYKDRGKGDALNAFRRDWEARNKDPETRRSSKPAVSNRKGAPQPVDTSRDVDASRTTADLQATLVTLEASLAKFDSPGTRKRVEELRRKIASRG